MSNSDYGEGYDGRLSNSKLNTLLHCGYAYRRKYESSSGVDFGRKLFTTATAGVVAHKLIEQYILSQGSRGVSVGLPVAVADYYPDPYLLLAYMNKHREAVADTQKDGERWGRVYKAPEMTSFWKKNYGYLDKQAEYINSQVPLFPFEITPVAWLSQIDRALANFTKVFAPRISEWWTTGQEVKPEAVVHWETSDVLMAGTVDLMVNGGTQIWDFKTGGKAWTVERLLNTDQLWLYAGAVDVPVSVVGIVDLNAGELVVVEGVDTVAKQVTLAQKRLKGHVEKYLLTRHLLKNSVAAGRGGFGCPCEVAYTKEGCPWVAV